MLWRVPLSEACGGATPACRNALRRAGTGFRPWGSTSSSLNGSCQLKALFLCTLLLFAPLSAVNFLFCCHYFFCLWRMFPPYLCLCSGILGISPASLTYQSDTILASKRVFNPFLGMGVIIPDSINPETVLMPSRRQSEAGLPGSFITLLHREIIGIPIVEISC